MVPDLSYPFPTFSRSPRPFLPFFPPFPAHPDLSYPFPTFSRSPQPFLPFSPPFPALRTHLYHFPTFSHTPRPGSGSSTSEQNFQFFYFLSIFLTNKNCISNFRNCARR